MRILIAEDDPLLADGLTRSMRGGEHAVDCVNDGAAADHALSTQTYDLAIIDLGLPRMDGFEVIKRLRKRSATPPVLILTARDALEDRVRGLDLGADDFMAKPFALTELEARIRALVRRGMGAASTQLKLGMLSYDQVGRQAWRASDGNDTPHRSRGWPLGGGQVDWRRAWGHRRVSSCALGAPARDSRR